MGRADLEPEQRYMVIASVKRFPVSRRINSNPSIRAASISASASQRPIPRPLNRSDTYNRFISQLSSGSRRKAPPPETLSSLRTSTAFPFGGPYAVARSLNSWSRSWWPNTGKRTGTIRRYHRRLNSVVYGFGRVLFGTGAVNSSNELLPPCGGNPARPRA